MRALRGIKPRLSPRNRRAGVGARDHGDWPAAKQSHAAHLALVPDGQPIWIRLGHASKERGRTGEAEAAYREAGAPLPDHAGAHVPLGHPLSSLGPVAETDYVTAA